MHPILLQLGSFILPSWHAFYLLAAVAGWWSLQRWYPRVWPEGDSRSIDTLFLLAYVTGYFGARGLSLILEDAQACFCLSTLSSLFQIGSMTLYGGVLAATASVLFYARRLHLPVRRLADLCLPSTLLGVTVGRIGCLLNGDDFGRPIPDQMNPAWWAQRMPNLEDGLYRYPVQLTETLLCLILAAICWSQRGKGQGVIGTIGICGYASMRFVLEFYRGDERGHFLMDVLSPAQVISLLVILSWALFLMVGRKQASKLNF